MNDGGTSSKVRGRGKMWKNGDAILTVDGRKLQANEKKMIYLISGSGGAVNRLAILPRPEQISI